MNPDYLCWLLGHKVDPIAAEHGYWDCVRCRKLDHEPVITFYRGIVPTVLHHVWYVPTAWLLRVWREAAGCRECGNRPAYGERCDCLPF